MADTVVAILCSSGIATLFTVVGNIIMNAQNKKHDKQTKISEQITTLSNDVKEMKTEIDGIKQEFENYKSDDEQSKIEDVRYRILRFADEIRHGRRHSEEHFIQIREDIDKYERYCKSHPMFQNGRAVDAIKLVRKIYDECALKNDFLV